MRVQMFEVWQKQYRQLLELQWRVLSALLGSTIVQIRVFWWQFLKGKYHQSLSWQWLIVYICKMPAVMEGFKKIRVAFFKKKWLDQWLYLYQKVWNYSKSNFSDEAHFFCKPQNDGWVRACPNLIPSKVAGYLLSWGWLDKMRLSGLISLSTHFKGR